MRGLVCLAAVCALAMPGAAAPAAASAGHAAKRCGILAKGSSDYRVRARRVKCGFARRWVHAYFKSRLEPGGFTCYRPGTDIALYCSKGGKSYWAERL
jgi:hypothetical protein